MNRLRPRSRGAAPSCGPAPHLVSSSPGPNGQSGSADGSGARAASHAVRGMARGQTGTGWGKAAWPDGGTEMGLGVSIFLLAVGAILTFAVDADLNGIDLDTVGVILMVVGGIGLLLTLLIWGSRERTPRGRVVRADADEFMTARRVGRPWPARRESSPVTDGVRPTATDPHSGRTPGDRAIDRQGEPGWARTQTRRPSPPRPCRRPLPPRPWWASSRRPGGVVGPTASRRGRPRAVSDPPFPVVTTRSPDPRCCRTGQGMRRCRHRRASKRGEDRSAMDPRMSGTTASAGRRSAHTPLRGQWTGRSHARSAPRRSCRVSSVGSPAPVGDAPAPCSPQPVARVRAAVVSAAAASVRAIAGIVVSLGCAAGPGCGRLRVGDPPSPA